MNFHKVVSSNPMEKLLDLQKQLEDDWAQKRDEQREQNAASYERSRARLAARIEQENQRLAQQEELREMAEAYNCASTEEQARPFHEWHRIYVRQRET